MSLRLCSYPDGKPIYNKISVSYITSYRFTNGCKIPKIIINNEFYDNGNVDLLKHPNDSKSIELRLIYQYSENIRKISAKLNKCKISLNKQMININVFVNSKIEEYYKFDEVFVDVEKEAKENNILFIFDEQQKLVDFLKFIIN